MLAASRLAARRVLVVPTPPARALSAAAAAVPKVPAGAEVLLYSYKICPYCARTRALLAMQGVPFTEVEVSPLTKKQLKWSAAYKKVPIAIFASDGLVVPDSAAIADALLERFGPPPASARPRDAFADAGAREWATWATSKLAVMMYPNMTRSWSECRQALAYLSATDGISAVDAFLTRTVGALGMALAHNKVKAKYGIADERAALWECLAEWQAELDRAAASNGESRGPFRGGAAPDWGDVAVFGVLGAADGLPLGAELRARAGSTVAAWLTAMDAAVPRPNCVK